MKQLSAFGLDADITVGDLRREEVLDRRLHEHHLLRLRRKNDLLGVIVDAPTWRALEAHMCSLEAQIEDYEEQAVRAIIAERAADAHPVHPTPEVIEEIDRQYRALTGE